VGGPGRELKSHAAVRTRKGRMQVCRKADDGYDGAVFDLMKTKRLIAPAILVMLGRGLRQCS
jgi:hypothetical protein